MAVLKPPQKMMPEKKPTINNANSEYFALGVFKKFHVHFKMPALFSMCVSISGSSCVYHFATNQKNDGALNYRAPPAR
jgi:hypothetical protein